MGGQKPDKALDQAQTGAPQQVIARDAVAREKVTSLYPVDRGHEPHALLSEPKEHSLGALLDIRFRPLPRPGVSLAKFRKRMPVREREFRRVANAEAFLQRVIQDHAASMTVFLCALGDRLGLFTALQAGGLVGDQFRQLIGLQPAQIAALQGLSAIRFWPGSGWLLRTIGAAFV